MKKHFSTKAGLLVGLIAKKRNTRMNKAFETAYNYLKDGVQCKLSRDGGVWTCERIDIGEEK